MPPSRFRTRLKPPSGHSAPMALPPAPAPPRRSCSCPAQVTHPRRRQVANFRQIISRAVVALNGIPGQTPLELPRAPPCQAPLSPTSVPPCSTRHHVQLACPGCQPLHCIRSNAGLRCPRGRRPPPGSAPARSGFGRSTGITGLPPRAPRTPDSALKGRTAPSPRGV